MYTWAGFFWVGKWWIMVCVYKRFEESLKDKYRDSIFLFLTWVFIEQNLRCRNTEPHRTNPKSNLDRDLLPTITITMGLLFFYICSSNI